MFPFHEHLSVTQGMWPHNPRTMSDISLLSPVASIGPLALHVSATRRAWRVSNIGMDGKQHRKSHFKNTRMMMMVSTNCQANALVGPYKRTPSPLLSLYPNFYKTSRSSSSTTTTTIKTAPVAEQHHHQTNKSINIKIDKSNKMPCLECRRFL